MVILTMSPRVDDAFECEHIVPASNKKDINMVRPCERYKELYDMCRSIKARLHQYYVYGDKTDCKPHFDNFCHCLNYRESKNPDDLDSIIEWEQNYYSSRRKTVTQNVVWNIRDTPPDDFNRPLPEFIIKRHAESLFKKNKSE